MEPKRKWHSCRLIVNNDTGRVKWCVGSEKTWKIRLKYLVLLPVILLLVILLCIFLSQYNIIKDSNHNNNKTKAASTAYYTDQEIMRAEERDMLKDIETAFIPPAAISGSNSQNFDFIRAKRQFKDNEEYASRLPTKRPRKTALELVSQELKKQNRTICLSQNKFNSSSLDVVNGTKINVFRFCSKKQDIHKASKAAVQGILRNLNNNKKQMQQNSQRRKRNDMNEFHEVKTNNGDTEVTANITNTPKYISVESPRNTTKISKNQTNNFKDKYYSMFQSLNVQNDSTIEMTRKSQASLMSRYMDKTIDPCQDFYQYACGNWDRYNPIPSDKSAYDTFEVLRERLDVVLKKLLEDHEPSTEPFNKPNSDVNETFYTLKADNNETINSITDAVMKAKLFYKSCMNISVLQKRGHKPLLDLLQKFGGWPIIDSNWNGTNFDWLLTVAQLRLYNNDILISEWVGPDIQNSQEYIVQLDQTTLGLPSRDYYLDPANVHYLEAYKSFMFSLVTLLGAPKSVAKADIEDMLEFEIELAKIIAPPEQRRNVTDLYQRLTIMELQFLIPRIPWKVYFSTVLNSQVNDSLEIVCYAMDYIQQLTDLIKETPKRTLANYLIWRFVRHRVNNLDDTFLLAKEMFYFVLYGREKSPPRWQNCVTQVNSNMGMAVGSLFVQKYFDEFSKNDTLYMTTEIQKSFRELLSQIYWLDSDTKRLAQMKVDAMKLRIGYPDFILDTEALSERYSDIDIEPDKYFENTLSILQHLTRSEQARLNQSVDKKQWNTAPAVVNAYYSRNKNQIIFPAGILQPPFYHQYFPRALNFGGIGVVIGHEITHGFDDKGRLFDRDGNLQRWWNDFDVDEFHGRSKCLIEQYNKYTITEIGVQVDGTNTQGENIADNGGIKQAYRAYQKWRKQNLKEDETLPGLNMTENKLFFLNFAQVWCGAMRPEATRNKIKTAVHSPGRYRVIGTLSNFPEFAQAFNCESGTPMNPANKCNVW